jgi:hypothetical protein
MAHHTRLFLAIIAGFFTLKNATSGAPIDITLATTSIEDLGHGAAPQPAEPPPAVPDEYTEYGATITISPFTVPAIFLPKKRAIGASR